MENEKQDVIEHLLDGVAQLPPGKVFEVIDFIGYLNSEYGQRDRSAKEADAFWEALQTYHLVFEPGELERLMEESQKARDLDFGEDDELLA